MAVRLLAGLCVAAILGGCGRSVPFAVTRQNATDEVAKEFVVSFGSEYTSRVRGDLGPGRRSREGLVTVRVPDVARAAWTTPDGARHCKQIRVADSAPAEFTGRKGFPTLIFKIVGPDEITVLFEVPNLQPDGEDLHQVLTPRRPLQITECAEARGG